MKNILLTFLALTLLLQVNAQQNLTPETLLNIGRVSAKGITKDKKSVIYSVKHYNVAENKSVVKNFIIPINGGAAQEITDTNTLLHNDRISVDGNFKISSKEVKIHPVFGQDFYPELKKSEVMIYDNLNYRHWDTWEDGLYGHIFLHKKSENGFDDGIDIMPNVAFDAPQKPFGGDEDFLWSPNGKEIIYVTKKKFGAAYAVSTNTDIYSYNIENQTTTNLSENMMGYDTNPQFSTTGILAWLSMKTDGFEADKKDIIVLYNNEKYNLTQHWDETVESFKWSEDGKVIYFIAPVDGTEQLFAVEFNPKNKKLPVVKQITQGIFNITGLVGQVGNTMVVSRTTMNRATELHTVDLKAGTLKQLTTVNDELYKNIKESKTERRYITTTDGKKMLVWVIYPPDFDSSKKYPTLLYCQGGPQSALTQFYSFRWNFQLMAANDYIIVAPNRRGMPGHGVAWNADISKDYGGQVMDDYLSAIDDISKESYVDKSRLGAIGASFGGYSVFQLAGIHENRFKTFISHDGIFNWKSMYGTTEEMWFVNWDLGGAYWEKENEIAQKSYGKYNPINHVNKWNTPIMIIQGGKDYRVPIGQALEAFQVAQLKGIKSRLIYLPNENHWVLDTQNAIVWHREFYKWLKETL
ncbi:MAG: prolyl oligopeptidase family serine peptidase [Flavobacteriaceae bacterium]|nr:prolyl oligopeptidase family serine peptidase [Flavobacteriaceae bacterium]